MFSALAPPNVPVVPRVKKAWSDEVLFREGTAELGRLLLADPVLLATDSTAEPVLFS